MFNKTSKFLVTLLLLASMSFASSNLISALTYLCTIAKTFLGVAALALIVLSGAVYAIGQIMGAETRSRAAVWATAMLTGAIIGAIIYVVAPTIVQLILGGPTGGVMTSTAC
jgi:hypothetical protein